MCVAAETMVKQCSGLVLLCRFLFQRLFSQLIDRGYVTSRVMLPRQNLTQGILTLQLHVDRIASIDMITPGAEQTPEKKWGAWRNAFPVARGDVLNVRNLDIGLSEYTQLSFFW